MLKVPLLYAEAADAVSGSEALVEALALPLAFIFTISSMAVGDVFASDVASESSTVEVGNAGAAATCLAPMIPGAELTEPRPFFR